LNEDRIEDILSRTAQGPEADRAAHIIGAAKTKPFRS